MLPTEQAIARVQAYRKAEGLTIYALAKKAELLESTLRHMDQPGWRPNTATLLKLEAVIPQDFDPNKARAA
jgi:transcriptional regulator with XRE-family HTH domain